MVDYKLVASVFNDFLTLYLGKKQIGIRDLYNKYGDNRTLASLLSNLDHIREVPVPEAMRLAYEFCKPYRGRVLSDKEWETVSDKMLALGKKYDENEWYKQVLLELLQLLEEDDQEIRKKQKDTQKQQLENAA